MAGTKKRLTTLCTAVASTGLLPQLFLFDPQLQPELVALHLGQQAVVAAAAAAAPSQWAAVAAAAGAVGSGTDYGGLLRAFLTCLLWVGSRSPWLQLVVSLTLSRYLLSCPHLLLWYAEEVTQLVMFGVAGQGGRGAEGWQTGHTQGTRVLWLPGRAGDGAGGRGRGRGWVTGCTCCQGSSE